MPAADFRSAVHLTRRRKVTLVPYNPGTPPPTTSTKHVTYFKLGPGELPTDGRTADYEALVVSQGGISGAAAQTPPALFYTSPQTTPGGDYALTTGTASANGWLLKNSAGSILNTSFGQPLLDPANQGARVAFSDELARRIASYGADGVFHDDVQIYWGGFQGDFNSNTPINSSTGAAYTQSSWQSACAGWCQYVGSRIKTQLGKYMVFNARGFISGDGRSDTGELTKIFWSSIGGAAATHLCIEYWVYTPQGTQRLVGTAWNQNWDGWQSLVAHAHTLGTNILTLEDAGGEAVPVYARATALLDYAPGDLFVWAQGTGPWRASYTKNLGAALSSKYRVGSEWRRDFQGGTIAVNPTTGTASIPSN